MDATHALKGETDALAVIFTALLQVMPEDQRAAFAKLLPRLAQYQRDALLAEGFQEVYFDSYDTLIERALKSAVNRP